MITTLAALAAVGLLVAALLGMVGLLVPPLLEQVRLIIAQAPQLLRQLQAVWEQVRQEEWIAALGEAGGLPESWLARPAASSESSSMPTSSRRPTRSKRNWARTTSSSSRAAG